MKNLFVVFIMQKKNLLLLLFIPCSRIFTMEKDPTGNMEQKELLIKARSALEAIGSKLMTKSFALCHAPINDPAFIENPYLYGKIIHQQGSTPELNDFYSRLLSLKKNSLLYKFFVLPVTGQLLFIDCKIKEIQYLAHNNAFNQYCLKLVDNNNVEIISFTSKPLNKECAFCKKNMLSMYHNNLNAAGLYIINFDFLRKLLNYSITVVDDDGLDNALIRYLFFQGFELQKKIDQDDIAFDKKFNIISFFRDTREKTGEIYNGHLGHVMSLMIFNRYIQSYIKHNPLELKADLYY